MSDCEQRPAPVVLVSGLSGAGKSTVLKTLEDLGFEAIDNPPLQLVEELVSKVRPPGEERRIAVGVDARTRGFNADAVVATLARLRTNPTLRPHLVFVWADEAVLQRRYTETRRRHPMSPNGRVTDGIAAEQALTATLRDAADFVVDTTDLPPAELRLAIERRFGPGADESPVQGISLGLVSFAFPAGLPREADMVFDARFLRNPHYISALRPGTGLDRDVAAYIEKDAYFRPFMEQVTGLLDLLLPRFVQEGKKYGTIAVGCTGGRHRSVLIVERLATHLTDSGWRLTVTHRELGRESGMSWRSERASVRAREADASSVQAQEA